MLGSRINDMKKNPKNMAAVVKVLKELSSWTQIEGGLERENQRAAQVWREVNDYARGVAMKLNLNLNE